MVWRCDGETSTPWVLIADVRFEAPTSGPAVT
jgi:hypothetical protein